MSTLIVPLTVTRTLSIKACLTLSLAQATLYVPGGTFATRYVPAPVLVVEDRTLVSKLVTVISAPGTAAPDASVTVPVMAPRSACAHSAEPVMTTASNSRIHWRFTDSWDIRSPSRRVWTLRFTIMLGQARRHFNQNRGTGPQSFL